MLLVTLALVTPQILGPEENQTSSSLGGRLATVPVDLDRDGDIDFVSTSSGGGGVKWTVNAGPALSTGLRTLSFDSLEPFRPGSVGVIDTDGDGDLDIVYAADSFLSLPPQWLENLGGEEFAGPANLPGAPSGASSLAVLDTDGDGDDDLLIGRDFPTITRMEAGATGLGSPVDILSLPSFALALEFEAGDLDGDGFVDLLWAERNTAVVAWSRGAAGGAVGPRQILGSFPNGFLSIDLADVDGDGDLDVSVGRTSPAAIDVLVNDGTGSFAPPLRVAAPGSACLELHAADLDGDGDAELLALARPNLFIVYENLGGFAFGPADTTEIESTAFDSGAVGADDLDGDGDLDAWCANVRLVVRLNDGSGSLAPARDLYTVPMPRYGARVVDIDADGVLELVSALDSALFIAKQYGTLRATWQVFPSPSQANETPIPVDIDLDGDIDVLLAAGRPFGPAGGVFLYENDGGLQPAVPVTSGGIGVFVRARVGDGDGDGLPDVLVESLPALGGSFTRAWWLQSAAGDFVRAPSVAESNWFILQVADVDGDGRADVLAAKEQGPLVELVWSRTTAGGVVEPSTPIGTVTSDLNAYDLAQLADVDGDGWLDLCASDPARGFVLARGLGGGAFGPLALAATLPGLTEKEIEMVDFDADGDLDALLRTREQLVLCENDGMGTFTPGVALASSNRFSGSNSDLWVGDLDGDLDLDVLRPGVSSTLALHRGTNNVGQGYCQAEAPGSNGLRPRVFARGSTEVARNTLTLGADRLPPQEFGLFVLSTGRDRVPAAGGIGTLCLGTGAARFDRPGEIRQSDAAGAVELNIDLGDLPTPFGPAAVAPGDVRFFQYWTRDTAAGTGTSNFSGALFVAFE